MSIESVNATSPVPSQLGAEPFTLESAAGTDTWRTPPATDRFSAPIVYRRIKLASFRRARVTAAAHWRATYDQAGLILVKPAAAGDADQRPHWTKAGLEVEGGRRNASVVRAEPYSDWSLHPLEGGELGEGGSSSSSSITIEFERTTKDGELTPAMWIYLVKPDGEKVKLRELTAIFDQPGDREAWVGVYTAQPIGLESKEPLKIEFSNFELETA